MRHSFKHFLIFKASNSFYPPERVLMAKELSSKLSCAYMHLNKPINTYHCLLGHEGNINRWRKNSPCPILPKFGSKQLLTCTYENMLTHKKLNVKGLDI